tara:strand:- start:4273 stop:4773 length:501 start_codon:yes stop_codon:yes gene_type:complete
VAVHKGSSVIYGVGRVIAIDSDSRSRGNVPQSVKPLMKVNGLTITAHNRSYSSSTKSIETVMKLASGKSKRFYKKSSRHFALNFKYLPDKSSMTVDGYSGRDDLLYLARTRDDVLVEYLPDYTSESTNFDYKSAVCYVSNYSETLLRRDELNGCYYYDVSISFEEL